jgi:hypothetical protein
MTWHRAPSISAVVRGWMACLAMAGLAAGAMAVPTVSRAASWTHPVVLAGPLPKASFLDRSPTVAINHRGQSLVAWNADPAHGRRVVVAIGTARGRFGAAVLLSRTGTVRAAALADDGTAIVVWEERDHSIRAAVRSAGGRFGHAQRISGTAGGTFSVPTIAVDRASNVLVAWTRSFRVGSRGTEKVEVVSRPAGRAFSPVATIGEGQDVRVAFNARGDAVASWMNVVQTGGTFPVPYTRTSVAQVATRPVRGTFGAPATVSGSPTWGVSSALTDEGTVGVVWEQANGPETDPYGAIQTSTQALGGAYEPPVAVPAVSARRSFHPMILYGSRGELVALWQEKTHSTPFSQAAPLRWAARMPGGSFGPRRTVTAAEAEYIQFAPTGDGRAVVAWTDTRLRAALYRSGSGFVAMSAPRAHPARSTSRSIAASGGFVVMAWQQSDWRLVVSIRQL